jgi:hypothetical protein
MPVAASRSKQLTAGTLPVRALAEKFITLNGDQPPAQA